MGWYSEWFVPYATNLIMSGKAFTRLRKKLVHGLKGEVLEVGFGSGLNLPHYPPEVTKILVVEPSERSRSLAKTVQGTHAPVEFVGPDAQAIPLPDQSVDTVVSAWTLCTIPDVERALQEIRRILRPGGVFRFVEHGLSDDPGVSKWQIRLNPLQKALAGGCHLNRKMDVLVRDAGFRLTTIDNFYIKGPKVATYMYLGEATV